MCLSTNLIDSPNASWRDRFFQWPDEQDKVEEYILAHLQRRNIWFGIHLLNKKERRKNNCLPTDLVWADLDECSPDAVQPAPSVVIESSPGRFQAVWRLEHVVDPTIAEDYSKRLAYLFKTKGADISGWDLTQLLRVPYTLNHKYANSPRVKVERALEARIPNDLFEALPKSPDSVDDDIDLDKPVPDINDLPSSQQILYKYSREVKSPKFMNLYTGEFNAEDDWSKHLWHLINLCFEYGMSAEETLIIANEAGCNKYKRDDRPIRYLWRDVLKAEKITAKFLVLIGADSPLKMPELDLEAPQHTIIDDYREWAEEATDAVAALHDLCSFILLSSLMSSSLRLETSYGSLVPNLWGLVLGDSTLARKTTVMQLATGFIGELDREIVLATDGSAEGLLTGLSTRSNQVSMFYKDEVTGFFDSINRKDYLAGMPETMTSLYDVPQFFTRRLRKETINIENPVFIFFGGGIKEKVYNVITEEYILSGFLPRFLIVSGETDITRIRRTGPLNPVGADKRKALLSRFADIFEMYAAEQQMIIAGHPVMIPQKIEAFLTNDAWELYGEIEFKMVEHASQSSYSPLALPTFERLSRSMLKMAVLLGATEQNPTENMIQIERKHVNTAATYMYKWGWHSIELVMNAGRGTTEKVINKAYLSIEKYPGILRSTIMKHLKLGKREADEIFGTLEDRGMIRGQKSGRGTMYWIT